MLNMKRNLAPVQRKPRMAKTITKKLRKPKAPVVQDKGWSSSHIEQSYTKM